MQSINIVVINPIFMTAMIGTSVTCLVLAVLLFFSWQRPGVGYLLAGSSVLPRWDDYGDDGFQRTSQRRARGY